MKPAAFAYHRVDTPSEALARLVELGEDAKVLAGGQSLVPMMNFRLVRPSALVDITRVGELRGMRRSGGALRIRTLTTHAEVEHAGDELHGGYEILRRAATWVGHLPIRSRGTFGGSLAHADPAAEWCMLALALDATIEVAGSRGEREVPAEDFLLGFFSTALEPGELLTAVRFPAPCPRAAIHEFARRRGDFAVVAAVVALPPDGPPRVVIGGVDAVPVRARAAERIVADGGLDPACFADAAQAAAAEIEPGSDLHASAGHRRRLTAVLVGRALASAVAGGR
jgi:carbon-monoxide dehydrogenase medium subunit